MVVVQEVGRVEALGCHMVVADLGEVEVKER
jgi:hypothetical protein